MKQQQWCLEPDLQQLELMLRSVTYSLELDHDPEQEPTETEPEYIYMNEDANMLQRCRKISDKHRD